MKITNQKVLNSIGRGIIAIDNSGKIIQVNNKAISIFGKKYKDVINKKINMLIHLKIMKNTINSLYKKELKINIKLDGQRPKKYKVVIFPIIKNKNVAGRVALIENVTREDNLLEAQTHLKNLVSNKLQVPTNIVKNYINLVMTGKTREIPKEVQELLASAYQSNDRLIRMLNNVLDMIDLESEEIIIKKKKNINLESLVFESLSYFDAQAKAKGLKLIYKKPNAKLPLLNINPSEIKKVLRHLLDNAIKFTRKGSITLSVQKKPNIVIVNVKDTGIGVSTHNQKFLFQRFLRLDETQNNKKELGLGLYICHMILEKHSGEIWVKSKVGKGSTFSFSLPINKNIKN